VAYIATWGRPANSTTKPQSTRFSARFPPGQRGRPACQGIVCQNGALDRL